MNLFNLLAACDPEGLETIFKFISSILILIQIVVPIILIIVGAFDLAKAVMGSDEKEIKTATQNLIKRAIAAVCVFLISAMVSVVIDEVSKADDGERTQNSVSSWTKCWKQVRGIK